MTQAEYTAVLVLGHDRARPETGPVLGDDRACRGVLVFQEARITLSSKEIMVVNL